METMQIHSRVGTDGILKLDLPLGPEEAGADVLVTIEPVISPVGQSWGGFLSETFGEAESAQAASSPRSVRLD
jgi:hypothetical protein